MLVSRIHLLVAAAAALLCWSPHATANQGRAFFIDPDSGSDDADGRTELTAWKTARGLQGKSLAPGDRVLFKAGTRHVGTVSVAGGGGESAPVLIGRYGSGKPPLIDGNGASNAIMIGNPDFMVIEDLEITNVADSPSPRNGLLIHAGDGTTAQQVVIRRLHVHHVSGHDDRNGGCGILVGAGNAPDGRASRYDGLTIEDCLLHDLPFNGILVSGWETRGRTVDGQLKNPSTSILIRGNLLHDIAGDAICLITTRGAVIEHNEVYRSSLGQVRGKPDAPSAAIWPHTSDGTIMRFNRVEGLRGEKDGQAFDVDFDCRDTLIENNFTRDNGTGFLLVCSGSDNGRVLETRRVVVRNNLCMDECAEAPGALFTFVSRVREILFENNAFIFQQSGERRFIRAGNWLDPGWPEDITFRRNLIVTAGSLYNESGTVTGIRFEGNLESGDVRFGSKARQGNVHDADLLKSLVDSFDHTGRSSPAIVALGFKPFDPSIAGLPRGSKLLYKAKQARLGSLKELPLD